MRALWAAAVVVAGLLGLGALAAEPRSRQEVIQDLTVARLQLRELLGDADDVLESPNLLDAAPQALPIVRRMGALLDELAGLDPQVKATLPAAKRELALLLAVLGDEAITRELERRAAAGDDPAEAAGAKAVHLTARWIRARSDAAAQAKVLDEAAALAQARPEDDAVTVALERMSGRSAASAQLKDRAESLLLSMKGRRAEEVRPILLAERKRRSLVGRPLVVSGTTLDGRPFTTADWKGKVVVVDFWATWCAPCVKRDLPRLKKLYAQHHARGLEIVGVSSDLEAARVGEFLAAHADAPWPQLGGMRQGAALHPLATELGVLGLPALIVIGRDGTCRSADAGEEVEELVGRLIAERPPAAATPR